VKRRKECEFNHLKSLWSEQWFDAVLKRSTPFMQIDLRSTGSISTARLSFTERLSFAERLGLTPKLEVLPASERFVMLQNGDTPVVKPKSCWLS
jgi:hypothetical protein